MLICEDGSGKTDANAYVTNEDATDYLLSRNLERWSDSSRDEQDAAIIRATDYLDNAYVFRSVRLRDEQALECPRFPGSLDPRVVRATIELALIALDRDLFALDPDRDIVSEEITGPAGLAEKTTYARRVIDDPFPTVTRILSGVATRRGASSGRGASSIRLLLS